MEKIHRKIGSKIKRENPRTPAIHTLTQLETQGDTDSQTDITEQTTESSRDPTDNFYKTI